MTPGPGIARTLLPKGFIAGGINCGVRKYRPDLGMVISDRNCVAAGVFTQNTCKAAPVRYSQSILPSAHIRAIVTNSGQANAATGAQGWTDNWKMVLAASQTIGCLPHQVVTASTGVIGVPLSIDKITEAMPQLPYRANEFAEGFALAILTTDLVPKTVTTQVQLSTGEVRITGICKGSGMIHPNMATMLGYLLTDADLSVELANRLLGQVTQRSFNMISVDGDTSTNDAVFLMANGASGVKVESDEGLLIFSDALLKLAQLLARAIARDGEGATKLIEIAVQRAATDPMAIKLARGLTTSPLIKSAIHGEDPNWGRLVAKLGAEDIPEHCMDKISIDLQGISIFEKGQPVDFDSHRARFLMKSDTVKINVDLNDGLSSAVAWGCDLSKMYVQINAEYAT